MTAPYSSSRFAYEGTETTETSIVRTGGAEDPSGQAQSRKIVTTANTQWLRPFRCEPWAIWNETVGADVTVTVYGLALGALPENCDVWLDVEYLGDASSTLGKIVTTTKANVLATCVSVASDSSVWSTPSTPDPPLDAIAGLTSAWSMSRDMLTSFAGGTRYTKSTGTSINQITDQSGNSRHLVQTVALNQPQETTAFPNGVLCADFDGTNHYLRTLGFAASTMIGASSGAVVATVIVDAVSINVAAPTYANEGIFGGYVGGYWALYARNFSGVTFYAYNWDGTDDAASLTGTIGTPYVLMWRHHGGNLYLSINGGTEVSVASGATSNLSHVLSAGTETYANNCKIAEMFTTSDGSQTAALATAIANMKLHVGA